MHIIINHSSMVPIYEQIVEAIKEAILSNQLSPMKHSLQYVLYLKN